MAFQRKTSNVPSGEYEIACANGVYTIPDICVEYFVGLTDTFVDITNMAEFAPVGTELGGRVPSGLNDWAANTAYAAGEMVNHPTVPNRVLQRLADTLDSGPDFAPDEVNWGVFITADIGLYIVSWKMTKRGEDAFSAWWVQECKLSNTQPKRLGEDPDPIARGVRRLPRTRRFIDQPTLIDAIGQANVNTAGDSMAGFTIAVPIWKYNFQINLSTYEPWLNLDGYVNDNNFSIPYTYRDVAGTVHVLGTIEVATGMGRLLIEDVPMEITEENGKRFLPIGYSIEVNPMGWTVPQLNQGSMELSYVDPSGDRITDVGIIAAGGPGVIVHKSKIKDSDGEPSGGEPQFLDEYGRAAKVGRPDGQKIADVTVTPVVTALGGAYAGTYPKLQRTLVTASGGFAFTDDHLGQGIVLKRKSDGMASHSSILAINSPTEVKVFEGAWPNGSSSNGAPIAWKGDAELYMPGVYILDRYRFGVADLSGVPI